MGRPPAPSRPCSTRRLWPTSAIATPSRRVGESPSATRPRTGDGWSVGGATPRSLPAGNANGDVMAIARQGSTWASRAPSDLAADPDADASPGVEQPSRRAGQPAGRRRSPRRRHAGARCRISGCRGQGPQAPGLRVPPVLDPRRQVDRPDLRLPLDDRLLQPRRRPAGQPPQARRQRQGHHGLGRLDEQADDERHQRRARPPHPGRPDDLRVRLDERPGGQAGRAPRQPGRAPQPRPPGGCRRAGPRGGRREPRLRADRVRPCRRLHRARADDAQGARPGPPRLPAHVRHDRLDRQLPRRGRRRGRAPPTRSSSWATTTAAPAPRPPARSTRWAGRATRSTTRSRPTSRACRRPSSSSGCRTTAGHGRRRAATSGPRTRAARSTGRPPRSCTAPPGSS